MLKFEEYLADFANSVNVSDFIINMIVATILCLIIKRFYIRFGSSFSNKEKFAIIFVPMALATLLIITVVQASIALSLGLVGALSIVRFRAAIKEPEELTYIFLIIGVGLTCGANKPILAIVALAFILPLIYLNARSKTNNYPVQNKMLISVRSKSLEMIAISQALESHVSHLEMRRMEHNNDGLYICYLAQANRIEDVAHLTKAINTLDKDAEISVMDQPEMIV